MRRGILPLWVVAITAMASNVAADNSAIGLMASVHNCLNADLPPESRIEACSAVIHTNLASGNALANFYYDRGAAYEAAHDIDHAKNDYDKALQLRPDFALAQTGKARLSSQATASPAPTEAH